MKVQCETALKSVAFLPDSVNIRFPGYLNILRPILKRSNLFRVATDEEDLCNTKLVIPFGVLKAAELAGRGYEIAYLIDSVTLGFKSVVLFYVRRRKFFDRELWWNLLRYLKYAPMERKIVRGYRWVVVASRHDAEYMRRRYSTKNIVVLENGVEVPSLPKGTDPPTFEYRLGMLNFWGAGRPHDLTWFLDDVLPALRRHYPGTRLILAGRGGGPDLKRLVESSGAEFIGEVQDLSDFFRSVDVFVTTMRKECGILNKVLDAFAHKKIVIGYAPNMKAFSALREGFLTYNTAQDLIDRVEFVKNHPAQVRQMQQNAFDYVIREHSWDKKVRTLEALVLESCEANAGRGPLPA